MSMFSGRFLVWFPLLLMKHDIVKSSQVMGLRTRTASFPTLMFSPPRVVGYDGDPGLGRGRNSGAI